MSYYTRKKGKAGRGAEWYAGVCGAAALLKAGWLGSASLRSGHWSRDLSEVRTRAMRRSGGRGFRAEGTESEKVLR